MDTHTPNTSSRSASLILALALAACTGGPGATREQITPAGVDDGMMYGQSGLEFVLKNFPVFRTRTDLVRPDREAVQYLTELKTPITILVFLGTWCHESQVHAPELFSALQSADNDRITLRVIGLSRSKNDRDGLVEKYEVVLTPTFVVEADGRELGRVVEVPVRDAAADIVKILRSTLRR